MAQIVTITNPLTGQPAQVDQLDHTAQQIDDAITRALPGGGIDTLLAGKAPAGYGLGTFYSPETDDCDTATKNGWYYVKGTTLNKPFNKVGALLVACRASTQMYQLFFVGETYGTGGSCIIVRSMYGGEWGPWEWVNPPMEVGVEYRTTERYKEKPVYVKAVNCGYMANNKTVDIITNSYRAIDIVLKGSPTIFPMVPEGTRLSGWQGGFCGGGETITLYAGQNLAGDNHSVTAIVKFIEV